MQVCIKVHTKSLSTLAALMFVGHIETVIFDTKLPRQAAKINHVGQPYTEEENEWTIHIFQRSNSNAANYNRNAQFV